MWQEERSVQHFPALTSPSDCDTESPYSQSFGVIHIPEFSMPIKAWGQPEKKHYVWDLNEIKPLWNRACDAPQGHLLFHRDHSPVSFAQGHPFHLCRGTVALLETGYRCFLSFSCYLLFYRPFLCSNQMRYTQFNIFKCPAPANRMSRVKLWYLLRYWSPWASLEFCVWPLHFTFWAGLQTMWFFYTLWFQ